ncbi:phospholipase A2 inhibitor gamma subunit B-like isoform X1 [Spea bombifrons]|uniref:phospholipase A2 inhibitor gamma subunit B-like isoform X1 n=1 Tax=Spea bombifrons TaxID=233779 RepID=UPI0023497C8F|nr:phospholipase A2 inhibitor gamma subunit B-like isoform X1 [Spea bombifrons]
MRSVFGFFCTLSALLSTCYSLSCTKCFSLTTDFCTGPSITCPADQVCASSYTITIARGVRVSQVYSRDCVAKQYCTMKGSMGFAQNSRSSMSITCCSTDNCEPPQPTLPAENNWANGLVCRSCISPDSLWCYTDDTIRCTGDENMCLLQTTKIIGSVSSSIALRGCATKNICDFGRQAVTTDQVSININFQCTSGSVGVFGGIFLPLLGIVLTKLLC